jgi:hypothetical protein
MKDSEKKMTDEEILEVIRNSSPEDYDGHIDWESFTFEQKLEWISRGARLWQEWGGILREKKEPYGKKPEA